MLMNVDAMTDRTEFNARVQVLADEIHSAPRGRRSFRTAPR